MVVVAARRNSLRTVAFDSKAVFRTVLVAVRRLTRLAVNAKRVWNKLSNTDRDRDTRHSCERSSAGDQVCKRL